MSECEKKFESRVLWSALCVISFLGGAGFLKPMLAFVAVMVPIAWRFFSARPCKIFGSVGGGVGFFLMVCFMVVYWGQFQPYRPEVYSFYNYHFEVLFFYLILLFGCLLLSESMADSYSLLWWFCCGAFVYASLTVLVSVYLIPKPFYGRLVDLRDFFVTPLVFSNHRPGISNLMCLFPAVWCAGLLLKKDERPKGFLWIGVMCLFVALIAQFYLQQRTFVIITGFFLPCMLALAFFIIKDFNKVIFAILFPAVYPLTIKMGDLFGVMPIERRIDAELLVDPRFQMLKHWARNLISDPWIRSAVGPDSLASKIWHHNFFADIHRLSGWLALSVAIVLCVYIFLRLAMLVKVSPARGLALTIVAFTAFSIMNTSVVPEGEMQPFVFLIMVYAAVESLLRNKCVPKSV